jgi:hypothetical protein
MTTEKTEKPAKKATGVKVGTNAKKETAPREAAAPKKPAAPVKPAIAESAADVKAEALPKEKQVKLDGVLSDVAALLDQVKEKVKGVFPERSPRWVEKRTDDLLKEIRRHLDKAARRA